MPRNWSSSEDEDFLVDRFDDMMMREELSGKFEVNVRTVSDKLEHLAQRSDKKRAGKNGAEDPLRKFGYIIRAFIMENIKTIDYRDIAELAGIPAEELREAVEKAGIKVDTEKVMRWADVDCGRYDSVSICARCDVQIRHSSFSVGYTDCRRCIEENIRLWVKNGHPIRIALRERD